jgi:hypothetical protein
MAFKKFDGTGGSHSGMASSRGFVKGCNLRFEGLAA